MLWHLGEKRYIYTSVTSSSEDAFIVSSATYEVYDTSDDSLVISGNATIDYHTIYTLWEPTEVGIFICKFDYVIGTETYSSTQVIEVKETI